MKKKTSSKKTDIKRGERMVRILTFLIRRRPRKFGVRDIFNFMNVTDTVSLRNVQRNLKELTEIPESCVQCETVRGKRLYFIEPDVRDKMTLPIQHNGLLALFLLKRLQPFFAPQARSLNEARDALKELSSDTYYELFEDLDERLEKSTFVFGEQSVLSLEGDLLNTLLQALVERKMLDITYRSSTNDTPVKRTICPAKLILFKQELYFVCISRRHKERNFYIKICRIVSAKLCGKTFDISPKQRTAIENRLSRSFGILDEDEPRPQKIVLQFPVYFGLILSERKFHETQRIQKDAKENIVLTMQAPVDKDLVQWVLGWSDSVRVIRPKALKERLYDVGKGLVEAYK